jgi:alpha-beta hydrolase superfamily lysophospholipase
MILPKALGLLRRIALNLGIGVLGFAVGVLAVYVLWARSGPPVMPWHEVELSEELTAERTGEIADLAAYLALEDRLFAEMDARIYDLPGAVASPPPGPRPGGHADTDAPSDPHPALDRALLRFSPGSAADPRGYRPNWNRTFELMPPAGVVPVGGVLLLHGMSDGPYSLRAIGEALAGRGYRVLGLRMPGHGTIPAGIRTVTWEVMAAATRLGADHLAKALGPGRPVHLIGYSTGAALAVGYTLDALEGRNAPVPASLVLVSPAIGITPLAGITPWLDRLSHLPGLGQLAWTSLLPEFDPFNYNSFSANASVQVHRMTRAAAARVRRLAADGPIAGFPPTLALLTAVDATVSPDAVSEQLLRHLAPGAHELLLYDINRFALKAPILVEDPAHIVDRLMADSTLPFGVTLITNAAPDTGAAVARYKPPFAAGPASEEALGVAWPDDAMSMSHVDLPFPPDDPLYGRYPPDTPGQVWLGQLAIRSERGVLKIPAQWLLRLRHNPFYDYQARRVLEFIDAAGRAGAPSPAPTAD